MQFLLRLIVYLIVLSSSCCYGSDRLDGRFSFSLTTFDTAGKLRQVEHATQAAALGTPVVAVCLPDSRILMVCPQVLPSPFISDDGTTRFNRITRNIVVAHSGLSADGRVLIEAAQRMAVEYAYTFDESMPIDSFLEEVSLLFQEYTMKPASRPFGCTLLVAHVPSSSQEDSSDSDYDDAPTLYRIDPSGSVETMKTSAVIGSLRNKASLVDRLDDFATKQSNSDSHGQDETNLMTILEDAIEPSKPGVLSDSSEHVETGRSYILASLSHQQGLHVRRERNPN